MANKGEDALAEFEAEKRPRLFLLIPGVMILLSLRHLLWFASRLKEMLLQRGELDFVGIYFFSLLILYPLIGIYGYWRRTKYGWVVLAHFSLSCSIIFLIGGVSIIMSRDNANPDGYLTVVMVALAMLANLICVVILFHKTYLNYFYLTRNNIFYVVIVTVAFAILNGIILSRF